MTQRGPTVRAAIKRLSSITIIDLGSLGVRDLRNVLKLSTILTSARNELAVREFKTIVNKKESDDV